MKSFFLNFTTLVMIGVLGYAAWVNRANSMQFDFVSAGIHCSGGVILLVSFIFGFAAAVIFMLQFLDKKNTAVKAYERRLEKTSVSNDESSAKIKVLESKIQVLEKSLEEALKRNSK